jgi:hypothetical protein
MPSSSTSPAKSIPRKSNSRETGSSIGVGECELYPLINIFGSSKDTTTCGGGSERTEVWSIISIVFSELFPSLLFVLFATILTFRPYAHIQPRQVL